MRVFKFFMDECHVTQNIFCDFRHLVSRTMLFF